MATSDSSGDPVAFLAPRVITAGVLLAATDHGWEAGLAAAGPASGGLEHGPDGTVYEWAVTGKRATLRVGNGASPVTVPMRRIVEHALRVAPPTAIAELRAAVAAHAAATDQIHPDAEAYRRHIYTPAQLTDAERQRIVAGETAQVAAERRMRTILTRSLTPSAQLAGEQLDLFGLAEVDPVDPADDAPNAGAGR